MRLLRKRPLVEELEIHLDALLEPYSSARVPAPEHQAIAAVRCPRCSRAIVYDARYGPSSCHWCEYERQIDLEREDGLTRTGPLRRSRRR